MCFIGPTKWVQSILRGTAEVEESLMKRIFLMIFVFGVLALYVFAPQRLQAQTYANCPTDADAVCRLYHGAYSHATGYCVYEACFEISKGAEVKVVAADELGDFPKLWLVWHEGTMTPHSCVLREQRRKTKVQIPGDKCYADLDINGRLYHEHFASNETTKCLGWVECTENSQ
jgi:hypothetical protein